MSARRQGAPAAGGSPSAPGPTTPTTPKKPRANSVLMTLFASPTPRTCASCRAAGGCTIAIARTDGAAVRSRVVSEGSCSGVAGTTPGSTTLGGGVRRHRSRSVGEEPASVSGGSASNLRTASRPPSSSHQPGRRPAMPSATRPRATSGPGAGPFSLGCHGRSGRTSRDGAAKGVGRATLQRQHAGCGACAAISVRRSVPPPAAGSGPSTRRRDDTASRTRTCREETGIRPGRASPATRWSSVASARGRNETRTGGPECQHANCRQLAAQAGSDWQWRCSCAGS